MWLQTARLSANGPVAIGNRAAQVTLEQVVLDAIDALQKAGLDAEAHRLR
jgi:hypothetical protein